MFALKDILLLQWREALNQMLISSQFCKCFPGTTLAEPELPSFGRTLWRACYCVILWLHFLIFRIRIGYFISDYEVLCSLYITIFGTSMPDFIWTVCVCTYLSVLIIFLIAELRIIVIVLTIYWSLCWETYIITCLTTIVTLIELLLAQKCVII